MKKASLRVQTLPVGQMQTNCYLVIDTESRKCIIIDPGDDADYIQRIIQDNNYLPQIIIATHGHFDHIMGVTELQLAYNIPFLIHKKDEFLVRMMQSSAKHFLGLDTDPPPLINGFLEPSEFIKLSKVKINTIETPGHTPGSICLYSDEDNFIICGDLLFAGGGVGRTDFSYSNPQELKESINVIFKLPKKTILYPGHGKPSTLQEELEHFSL